MRNTSWVSSAVLGAVAAGVLGGGVAPTAASAATPDAPPARPYDAGRDVSLGTDGAATLLVVGERIFVADVSRDRVLVLNRSGATTATIVGQAGAASLTASPDGSKVFVALREANAISAIDVATATESSRWSVEACPTETAFSSGRLFYSYGCSSGFGVASVDPASTAGPVSTLLSLAAKPKLAGTATHLVIANESGMGRVLAFASNPDGSATQVASSDIEFSEVRDLAVSPDGTRVAVAAAFPGARSLSLPSLAFADYYVGDDPRAVAYSPDGTRLFVGGGYGSTVRMYDEASGIMQWQQYSAYSSPEKAGWGRYNLEVLPAAVGFAADGSSVYALTADSEKDGVRLFRSNTSLVAPTVSIAVKTKYNRATQVTVSVPGVTSGTVRLHHTYAGMTGWSGRLDVTNGVARKTLPADAYGRLDVIYLGDAGHMASEITTAYYKRASRVSIAMAGTKTVGKNGITRYATHKDVTARFAIQPKLSRQVLYVNLWTWRKGKWVTDGYTEYRLDNNGELVLVFKERVPGKLSFTAFYKGNARYGESGRTGTVFTIAK